MPLRIDWTIRPASSLAKHLVHSVCNKHNLVRSEVVKNTVIILIHAVAVPVTKHYFHCHESKKPFHVKSLFQPAPTDGGIFFTDGLGKCPQTSIVCRI